MVNKKHLSAISPEHDRQRSQFFAFSLDSKNHERPGIVEDFSCNDLTPKTIQNKLHPSQKSDINMSVGSKTNAPKKVHSHIKIDD